MAPMAQVDVPAAFSLLGFVLITVPLFWQLRAWNVGCVLYIFWIGGLCLTNGINMLLWRKNAINFAPVWCDIYIRFYIASGVGVVSSTLVITHRLYHIANMTTTNPTRAQRRRNIIIDLLIGLGIPLLAVALYWFYQGHRFDIFEGIGCIEAYPNTFLSLLLNTTWPIPIGLVSAIYAVLALRGALDRTKDLKQLQVVEPGLTTSRYYRLMALAGADLLFTIPLTIYMIVINLRAGAFYPYRGMADLHWGFGRVRAVAAIVWRADPSIVSVTMFRVWTPIACATFFFLMFGFTAEARAHYGLAMGWVAKRLSFRFRTGRAVPEMARAPSQRPVVDIDPHDDFENDKLVTKPTVADGPSGACGVDVDELPPLGRTGLSAYRVERSSKKGDIVVMSSITEPPPAYTRSPLPLPSVPSPSRSMRQHIDYPPLVPPKSPHMV